MSTAKRKKRSSSLKGSLNPSKRHRDRFNVELDNLAKLLPFPNDVIQKLDKLSILRLSASYLRAKNFFKEQHWTDASEQASTKALAQNELSFEGNGVFSKLLLEALDGFVIVLTQEYELFYASETIQEYLGLSQASVIHQDFMRFIHVDDHELIKNNLQQNLEEDKKIKILDDENDGDPAKSPKLKDEETTSETGSLSKEIHTERSFVCRMKCILNTSAGFFKPFKCNGRLREMTLPDKDKKEFGLFLICTPMETMTNSILEIRLKTSLFCSKNRMDLSFVDIDQKGRALLGYHKRDIALQSSYCMIHFEDIPVLKELHVDLMAAGKCQGTFRLLNKNLKWQWLTGTAQVVFKGNEPDFVITTNRPLSDEEGEEVLRQRGQHVAALPFVANDGNSGSKNPRFQHFYDRNKGGPTDYKFPEGPAKFFPGNKKVPGHSMGGNGVHPPQHCYTSGPATSPTDGSLSPQANLSSFHDDGFSSTACTSAPASPDDLDLGVDLQDELMTDPPDLSFLSQDFPLNEPDSMFFDPNKDTDLIDHMSQLAMDPNNLGDLPTLEETIALVQDVISTTTSLASPDGSYISSHTPPHVNCDPFSPSYSQPSPFLSPANSQVSGPSMPSPGGVPTPDPSPLGRRDGEQARVNISWQGARNTMPSQMHNQQPMQQQSPISPQNCLPYGSCSPNYSMNPPNGNVMSSKSAYLASVKKRERDGYKSCVGNPSPQGYPRMQQPYNPSAPQSHMNSYNWNNGSYQPLTHMQNSGNYPGMAQNNDPTWGQPSQTVPPFEDTLPNIDCTRTNILSPPYQDDGMTGYTSYPNNHVPVTTMQSTKLGGW